MSYLSDAMGVQGTMAACEVESSGAHRLLVGGLAPAAGSAGQLFVLDLATAQVTSQVSPRLLLMMMTDDFIRCPSPQPAAVLI